MKNTYYVEISQHVINEYKITSDNFLKEGSESLSYQKMVDWMKENLESEKPEMVKEDMKIISHKNERSEVYFNVEKERIPKEIVPFQAKGWDLEDNAYFFTSVDSKRLVKTYWAENAGEAAIMARKEFIAKLICRDKVEKSMFIFTKSMIATERNFKLKVYPSLAMAAFMPILFAFTNSSRSFIENIQTSLGGKFHFLIYMSILALCFCTAYINNSDSYKGAFIYRILPIKDPGLLLKGAIKGILFKIIIVLVVVAVVAFAVIQAVYWLNLDNKIMFLLYKIFNKITDKVPRDRRF